jgi:hypothetical protein
MLASIQGRHISSNGCRSLPTTAPNGSGAISPEVYTASCSAFPLLAVGESLTLFFVDDLESALEQFRLIANDLGGNASEKGPS